jgi:acyl-coenzyme A thioesterase PaaI-like protein
MGPRVATMAGICALALLGLAACEQPAAPLAEVGPPLFTSSGPTLVECPSDVSVSAEGQIGSTGGSVVLNNHRLDLPTQAVNGPNSFTLTDPAAQYMVLDLKGNGQDSFGFNRPVTVTIDYSRCSRSNIDKGPLVVWKIDPSSKALLRNMGGTDDKIARTITFSTDSLSIYSLAN